MVRDRRQVPADPDQRRGAVGQVQVGTALLDQESEHGMQVEPGCFMAPGLLLRNRGLLLWGLRVMCGLTLGLLRYRGRLGGTVAGRRGVLPGCRRGHQTRLGGRHQPGLTSRLTGGSGHRLRNVLGREKPGGRRLSCGLPGIAVLHRILLGTVPGRSAVTPGGARTGHRSVGLSAERGSRLSHDDS
ncbi:hypothetical protein GCM10022223_65720 [Kineosporia mesophila]|uniref:Uncharacterized protein n=1 Tax=Kineosporia mesophila TaxID=566012 RepID=A0ABP7APQ1_9ACTN